MEDLEVLFSEEFAIFSRQIAAVAETKKQQRQEFDKVVESFKQRMKECDETAKKLQLDFERWKKERAKKTSEC